MTVISYAFLRNQLVPIQRLAAAAEAFGKGQSVPYRLRGALEVRAAGAAFLDMRARIERQIEQRTLLLSGVSHDLRTPLTRLRLALSMAADEEEAALMLADVRQMERLVDEFLAFARGDAMEETAETDPATLARALVSRLAAEGLPVAEGRIDGRARVRMRAEAVGRALENLARNAARFGSRVQIGCSIEPAQVRFTVEDDGPGIPRDRRDEALRPFTRLDTARDPNHGGGVGLGLSIAADVARSHGGRLVLGESAALGGLRADLMLAR
jgi:two-component system osmolarity sensor histidine kinase EnvZ